jgi:hypothetical protein
MLFKNPEIIQLAVMLYVWFPLSLRNLRPSCMKEARTLAVLSFGTGGSGLALISQARPKISGQGHMVLMDSFELVNLKTKK